jgi:adenosine kinase
MNIIITGSIAFDYIMSFPGHFLDHIRPDRLQKISVSFLVDAMKKQRGGCATNIAYTLALLGERPRVMATVGEDFAEYRTWLESCGVDTSLIRAYPGEFTASFFVNTDLDQNQIATFYAGAMLRARELSFYEVAGPVDMVVISPNDPVAMERYVAECKALNIPYLYDPSQQVARVDGATLRAGFEGADMLIVNDYEFELIKEKTGMRAEDIRAAVKRALIVTQGPEGSLIWADQLLQIPVVPPERIEDPTGVGDAYRAGLLKGLSLGLPWEVCGRIGALAATYVLERMGPQSHHYTMGEFVARYRENFGDDAFVARMRA